MNLFEYVAHEQATFDERPFCPADSAVLSLAVYIDPSVALTDDPQQQVFTQSFVRFKQALAQFMRIPQAQLTRPETSDTTPQLTVASTSVTFADLYKAEYFDRLYCSLLKDQCHQLLTLLVASRRFRDLQIAHYSSVFDEVRCTQFAAATFVWRSLDSADPSKSFAYVAYRGTDESFCGWREDFEMAVSTEITSQRLSVRYLDTVANALSMPLILGGHSKGGNLATWAALHASPAIQERITQIFDHDGPGFRKEMASRFTDHKLVKRIHRTIPPETLVGIIMHSVVSPRCVASNVHGAFQHDISTWEISLRDFVYLPRISSVSHIMHTALCRWLDTFDQAELPYLIDILFEALQKSDVRDVYEFFFGGTKTVARVIEAAQQLTPEESERIRKALTSFVECLALSGFEAAKERFSLDGNNRSA